ncbi:hypothetical protein BD626DRAFT_479811 [Schizophyllum amplum]|uniref:Yeast cell wall synthesis Kre9/Knh1-like N-terminal domain-containing protein n=1 Tax=Schizophyllum amplum TaxID=97359 RepID=A0A550CSK4_9AGAR|nr:hypothetical protein BD626DRAFT_479811 [Auriculariopsis ampla]
MPPTHFHNLQALAASDSASLTNFTPTAPGPGDVFKAGENCTIKWDVDQTDSWKNVTIDLMSGSNNNMSYVANVVAGLDGTDTLVTPFNWTCPELDPYSAIYFYQFTNGEDAQDAKWTTRFTISSPSGDVQPPEQAAQPDGSQIPWGTGHLSASSSQDDTASSVDDAGEPDDKASGTDDKAPASFAGYTSAAQASSSKASSSSTTKSDSGSTKSDSKKEKDKEREDEHREKHAEAKSKHSDEDGKHLKGSSSADRNTDEEDDDHPSHHPDKHGDSEKDKKGGSSDSGDDEDDERPPKSSKSKSDESDDEKSSKGDDDKADAHSAKTASDDEEPSGDSSSSASRRPAGAGQSPLTMSLPPSAKGSVDTLVHSDSPYASSSFDRETNSGDSSVPSLPVAALVLSYTLLFFVLL